MLFAQLMEAALLNLQVHDLLEYVAAILLMVIAAFLIGEDDRSPGIPIVLFLLGIIILCAKLSTVVSIVW